MKFRYFIAFIFALILVGCQNYPNLETVPKVEVQKYMGTWYEIARLPNWFEKNCKNATATYSLNLNGSVKVVNKCTDSANKDKIAQGIAYIDDVSTNSKLKVSFFWPFYGKYWIIELANDYSYAVIGHPNRKYFWILARTPKIDEKLYNQILKRAKSKGFDVANIIKN